MIGLEDRQEHARDIEAACKAGARLHEACEVVGITARTLQRWRAHQGLESGDGRPNAVPIQGVRERPGRAPSCLPSEP
jgi:hypothetical protein